MRLPLLLLSTLLMLFAAAPSFAATYRTPEALIKALYRYDPDETDAEAPSPYTPFFSDALNARFQADRDAEQSRALALAHPTYLRGTRGAIRVTISYEIVPSASAQSCAVGSSPNTTASSPAATSSSPTSTTNWSMQTVPLILRRLPPSHTSAVLVAARGMPSPYPRGTSASVVSARVV